jgi:hypothetical protein
MHYNRYCGGYRYPLLDNRAYGLYNEYSQLNDLAIRNNYIYANNVASNYAGLYRPSYYAAGLPYLYSSSYANPYLYGATYPYYL